MALIENWNTELRGWFLRRSRSKPERQEMDDPFSIGLMVPVPAKIRNELEVEAVKRGVTVAELCSKLISVTTQDGLVPCLMMRLADSMFGRLALVSNNVRTDGCGRIMQADHILSVFEILGFAGHLRAIRSQPI